jgi:uncharacterized iron-regulated membrane protein
MKKRWNVRDLVLVVHRWTGLAMAVFLVIVGLTGTLLAFREPINRLFNPGLYVDANGRQPLDLATLAERAEAQEPKMNIWMFTSERHQALFHVFPRRDPITNMPMAIDFDQLILDPYTGKELGHYRMDDWSNWQPNIMNIVYGVHTALGTRSGAGWQFMGYVALVWTIDSLVAIWLTFPRGLGPFWLRWQQAWSIKWRAGITRVNFDLHRAGGLWLWPLLFVFGWSSVMFGLPQVYEPVMHTVFGKPYIEEGIQPLVLPQPLRHPRLTWRQAQTAGEKLMAEQAALHHFTVTRPYALAYVGEFGTYSYCVRTSRDIRGHGWDTALLVDANNGTMRHLFLPSGENFGDTISTVLWGIHYADLRDWFVYRIFIGFFGIFLAVLSITGVLIWSRKRAARRQVRVRATQPTTAA